MRKTKILIILAAIMILILGIQISYSATVDDSWVCKSVDVTDWYNFSNPVNCLVETSEFLNTDQELYFIVKLSGLEENDIIIVEVRDDSGSIIETFEGTVPQDLSIWYDYRQIKIAEKNLQPGEYSIKMFINGNEMLSSSFTIIEDISHTCVGQGFSCCPRAYICTSPKEGICDIGVCCESSDYCQSASSGSLSRREVTNCREEGLPDCYKVVKLYEYQPHGVLESEQIIAIYFTGQDIDCYDKTDVVIAYYNETANAWVERKTFVEKNDADNNYAAYTSINQLGYIALIRSSECVPTSCNYGSYRTIPVSGDLDYGETITFEFCGMTHGCNPTNDGICDPKCPGNDPDCGPCTFEQGDCCMISYDNKSDRDCAPFVDPDYCDKSKELCCPGSLEQSGSYGCDKNCGTSDISCSGCTSAKGDCCKADIDGVCDPDCPIMPDGFCVDSDCCTGDRTSMQGDCCNSTCGEICDFDCMVGIDPDCHYHCELPRGIDWDM